MSLAWVATCLAAFFAAPTLVDRAVNRVDGGAGQRPGAGAVPIVDLHADSLLWPRDLSRRHRRGHADVPRLLEGGTAVQVFGLVSKVPLIPNLERNDDDTDLITLLALASRWPRPTWRSPLARALYQADRLRALAADPNSGLRHVETRRQLEAVLAARAAGEDVLGALLAVEGAHALEADLGNLDRLFAAGVRMMSPSHFFDTRVGGSAHGVARGGLSDFGRDVVRRMEELGMTVDLAHAAPATIDDVMGVATRPVVVSHTGVTGTCAGVRNLEDRHLLAVAAGGGVIGIGYWETAVCGTDVAAIARAIRYTADLVGHRHVALGSDFDGAVAVPFDATGLPVLVEALRNTGFSADEIADIAGRNAVRVLSSNLPTDGCARRRGCGDDRECDDRQLP